MSARSIVRKHEREQRRSRRRAALARRSAAATAAALAAGAIGAGSAEAASFTVSNLNDSGPGSLRQAVSDANGAAGADTITFQSGLSGTVNVGAEMSISDDLTITGPGPGALTLDGGDADRIFNGSNAAVSISGLTLANGDSTGDGGAATFDGPSLALDDVTVTGSQAKGYGGGIYLYGNDVTITNSRFSGNTAGDYGGGFMSYGRSPAAPTDAISITGSTFTDNEAGAYGGAIALYDNRVDVSIDRSTIANNTVTDSGGVGGGIWFEDTYDGHSTTLSNSTVTGNSAPKGGGGVSFSENFYGPAAVINSTIAANTTTGNGGGVNFASMDPSSGVPFTLIDSTVTGNSAASGGGVFRGYANYTWSSDSPLDVSSSVVAGNTATGSGADFAAGSLATGALSLGNVFAGNLTGVTYTADPAGSNIIGGDPMLGPLADNGGPTETRLPEIGSPLIDAGLANGLSTDQRGEARTVDYPDVPATHGSDGTDIGATELAAPPDNEVTDPYLAISSPQKQGNKKVKLKVVAGAGEPVTAQVWGKIWIGKGNAVAKTEKIAVPTDGRTTVTVNPKKKKATRRILKALANGRKVTAKLTGKLADEAGNEYQQNLQAKLKSKK